MYTKSPFSPMAKKVHSHHKLYVETHNRGRYSRKVMWQAAQISNLPSIYIE